MLFTGLVASTERAASLGDRQWREVLEAHHRAVRRELALYGGVEIDTAGDGFFCRFEGPAARSLVRSELSKSARELELEVRAGVHTGECEIVGEKIAGIAVVTGARISALAGPGEVLVSRTVKDLVAGSASSLRIEASRPSRECLRCGSSTQLPTGRGSHALSSFSPPASSSRASIRGPPLSLSLSLLLSLSLYLFSSSLSLSLWPESQ